jgi:hypothetical protein
MLITWDCSALRKHDPGGGRSVRLRSASEGEDLGVGVAVPARGRQLPAATKRPNPISEHSRIAVRRAHQHTRARLSLSNQRTQQIRSLLRRTRPQRIQQIVDHHHPRSSRKRLRKPNQQLLTRRQIRPPPARTIKRTNPLQHLPRPALRLPAPTPHRKRPPNDLHNLKRLRHTRTIQPHKLTPPQPHPLTLRQTHQLPPTQPNAALLRHLNPSRNPQQRRLPRQPPTNNRHNLPSLNLKRRTTQQRHPTRTTRQTPTNPHHHQHRHDDLPIWPVPRLHRR